MANVEAIANTATSRGYTVAADIRVADPFTESNLTWVEVTGSTAADWTGFYLTIGGGSGTSGIKGMVFVATGASASESHVTVLPTMPSLRTQNWSMYVPIPIAAGTRVAIAVSAEASRTYVGTVTGVLSANFDAEPTYTIMESGPYDLSNTTTYGQWVTVDPGATGNTKGSWVEVSQTSYTANVLNGDSLANSYDYFGALFNDNFNAASSTAYGLGDIATGAAASEVTRLGNLDAYQTQNEQGINTTPIITNVTFATSTTRISARCQCSITNTTDRIRGVLLFGVR